jgi:hypothetical protein
MKKAAEGFEKDGWTRQTMAIDKHTLKRLKIMAIDKEMQQQEILLQALIEYLDRNEKPGKA